MDINVAGLNKVVCFASGTTYNGRTVEITDGINTWTDVISDLSCVFMIPSMPAPAKRTYTVTMYNADGTAVAYTRNIELGFGDSVRIGLYENDEVVTKGTVPVATSTRVGGFYNYNNPNNGVHIDSSSRLVLDTATSSQKGGVKVSTGTDSGIYMNSDTLSTKYASTSQAGVIKLGEGLNISNGVAKVAAAGTTNSTKGGVYVQANKGIILNNDGEIFLETASDTVKGGVKVDGHGLEMHNGTIYVNHGRGLAVNDGILNVVKPYYEYTNISITSHTISSGNTYTFSIDSPFSGDYVYIPISVAATQSSSSGSSKIVTNIMEMSSSTIKLSCFNCTDDSVTISNIRIVYACLV